MKICLVMMVKNESAKIEQALTSCEHMIDSYIICDSGSTDDTKQKIKDFMDERNIPGEILDIEWKNFGYSKSIMMKEAHERSTADYFLFMDGRELVKKPDNTNMTQDDKKKLEEFLENNDSCVFMVKTVDGGTEYRRWNFFKNNQVYEWRSPVHEYLVTTKPGSKTSNLDIFNIHKNGWGGSGHGKEKYLNYVRLLKEYIDEHKDKTLSRETYYVAQSYKDAGEIEQGIDWYKKRIEIGDFSRNEEGFISMLTLFRYYKKNKDEKELLYYLFRMKKEYPHRLEGLFEGMMYFKDKDRDAAYSFGIAGLKCLTGSKKGYLFLEKHIYEYMFLFEFCLVAHYSNHDKETLQASKLLEGKKMPGNIKSAHVRNVPFYKKRITSLPKYINPSIKNLHPNIVIIDNVLKDPDARRKFALDQPFDVTGNFPNKRTTNFASQEDKEMIEKALGAKITYWPGKYNGSYQYALKGMKSWIHRDATEYSAILYLTPNPLISGGTETFMHKKLNRTYSGDKEINKALDNDSYNKSAWDVLDSVGCLYNRMIIFNGMQSHQSRDYFGDCKENARLFQVFFFNISREFPFVKHV